MLRHHPSTKKALRTYRRAFLRTRLGPVSPEKNSFPCLRRFVYVPSSRSSNGTCHSHYFFLDPFFFAGAFFFALLFFFAFLAFFFAAMSTSSIGSERLSPSQISGENPFHHHPSSAAEYTSVLPGESREDQRFGNFFLKCSPCPGGGLGSRRMSFRRSPCVE